MLPKIQFIFLLSIITSFQYCYGSSSGEQRDQNLNPTRRQRPSLTQQFVADGRDVGRRSLQQTLKSEGTLTVRKESSSSSSSSSNPHESLYSIPEGVASPSGRISLTAQLPSMTAVTGGGNRSRGGASLTSTFAAEQHGGRASLSSTLFQTSAEERARTQLSSPTLTGSSSTGPRPSLILSIEQTATKKASLSATLLQATKGTESHRPSLSSTLPHRPSLSSTLPHRPSLSSTLQQCGSGVREIEAVDEPQASLSQQLHHSQSGSKKRVGGGNSLTSQIQKQSDVGSRRQQDEKLASRSSNIKELYSIKDGNNRWRVKDYYGTTRVLTNDITGNDIFHSMVEIGGKIVNKKMLKMPYEISIATQLLANMNKTTKRKILNIGLGGGEMANFLNELDPTMEITSVEISNSIIEIAQKYFGYMKEQKNQSVVNEDGIEYIKSVALHESNILEAILIDACNATAESILTCPVNGFITEKMAQKMHALLKDGGVLVMNIYADKSVKPENVKRELLNLQTIFRAHFKSCYFVKIEKNENMTFTCVKSSQQSISKSNGNVVKSQKEYEKKVASIKIPSARWAKNVLNQIKTQLMVVE